MRMRAIVSIAVGTVVLLSLWLIIPWNTFFYWTIDMQRQFQDAMARSLRAVQSGDAAAILSLCAATAFYGFVHAAGPGHGKILLGGAALASGASMRRMAVLTVVSSVAQAGTAIALVGTLAFGLKIGALRVGEVADTWLAPASYVAIAAMGAYLALRGIRMMRTPKPVGHHHHVHDRETCGCGHAHGPSVQQVTSLTGWRDGAALVASIAIRPCTGALFLLAIALRFDLFWIGALAVITMGLGTASFNLMVAGSGVIARRVASIGAGAGGLRTFTVGAHLLGGGLILALSLAWLWNFGFAVW